MYTGRRKPAARGREIARISVSLACLVFLAARADPYPPSDPAYRLVWSDEFTGPTLDTSKWSEAPWFPGGVNENTVRIENGKLVMKILPGVGARGIPHLSTARKFEPKFGYWESCFKMQSLDYTADDKQWTAFWSMPVQTAGWTDDPWESGCEIDIWEINFPSAGQVGHWLHWGSLYPNPGHFEDHRYYWDRLKPVPPNQVYHTIGLEWTSTPKEYNFYIDGALSWRTRSGVSGIPQYILLGWCLIGSPSTVPIRQDIISFDYVRYYEKSTPTPTPTVRRGDLDEDGDVDLFDVLRLIDILLGRPPAASEYELRAGDMDQDGDLDLFDALALIDELLMIGGRFRETSRHQTLAGVGKRWLRWV